jgi:16S rRNA (cytidine1402-2'-O)-methyltransferase
MGPEMAGTLYLVGTPIGNLGDLTDRARATLGSVDVVAAEDTRRTGALLRRLGMRAPELVSFFEGNERERAGELLRRLRDGRDVAVVTDAGMPSVSDPGFRLVRACVDEGIDVRVVPGPSAAVAALVVSGLPTDRVAFEGFLPRRAGERRKRLQALADDPRTLVLFESPRRVAATLGEIVEALGDRRVALARELTKVHEEVLRGTASEVHEEVGRRGELKGEVVLVVEGAAGEPKAEPPKEQLLAEAQKLAAGGMRKREAAAEVARRHGASANAIYRELIGRGPPEGA